MTKCNIMYSTTVHMGFYFNINMDSKSAKKYYTLMCFHLKLLCFFNHYTPIVWLSICGCCKDVATSLLAYVWPKACYWTWFYTCVISPRFTPMYLRGWTRRLALKLYWNMSNHWRWPSYNEIDSLLFYKFSFNQSFSWN